jgi:hypothetical protein
MQLAVGIHAAYGPNKPYATQLRNIERTPRRYVSKLLNGAGEKFLIANLREWVDLQPLNTLALPARARYFYRIETLEQLRAAVSWCWAAAAI